MSTLLETSNFFGSNIASTSPFSFVSSLNGTATAQQSSSAGSTGEATDLSTSATDSVSGVLSGASGANANKSDSSSISGGNQASAATYSRNAGTTIGLGSTAQEGKVAGYSTALRAVENLTKQTKAFVETAANSSASKSSTSTADSFGALIGSSSSSNTKQLGLDSATLNSNSAVRSAGNSEGQLPFAIAAMSTSMSGGGNVAGQVLDTGAATGSSASPLRVSSVYKA